MSLTALRAAICREIRLSQDQGELAVRPQFEALAEAMILPHCQTLMLVTTNWDTVIPDALRSYLNRTMEGTLRPLHIHGSIARQDTLYLPTEVTREPYRSPDEDEEIGTLHTAIMFGLEKAHRVVMYGLSLSPLDAELGQTLAAGWSNPNLQEISIVTPDHETVAHRVNLLLDPRREVIVRGYAPENLKSGIDYTIKRKL